MRPRGATPRLRSGAEARGTHAQRAATKRNYATSEVGAVAERARLQRDRNGQEELPTSEVRTSVQEEQPHFQGAVAEWAQEGLEELSHVEGQEGQR